MYRIYKTTTAEKIAAFIGSECPIGTVVKTMVLYGMGAVELMYAIGSNNVPCIVVSPIDSARFRGLARKIAPYVMNGTHIYKCLCLKI